MLLFFFRATDGQIIEFLEKVIPINEIVRFERVKTFRGEPMGYLILEVASEEAAEVKLMIYLCYAFVKRHLQLYLIYSK